MVISSKFLFLLKRSIKKVSISVIVAGKGVAGKSVAEALMVLN